MEIELTNPYERMSESGSSLLRLIQNNNTPRLDLLVRESLQNCLDAGDGKSPYVSAVFHVGQFETEKTAPFFKGISEKLIEKYPGKQSYIAIQDENTVGLTGPIRKKDVQNNQYGNYLKLVSEICKPQDHDGSGGSWGLGKTVYFRMGIGLVCYYSRIFNKDTQKYESRLAAAFVEDESKSDAILPEDQNIRRGIAWWGRLDPETSSNSIKQTIPLNDENEIKEFLDGFGLKPFPENITGTEIIIPFINESDLLKETINNDSEFDYPVPYWCKNNIEDYLVIAAQRWYAPRLDNKEYHGQYLELWINERSVTFKNMAPVFQLIQMLYNARPDKNNGDYKGSIIKSKPIELRNIFNENSVAGYINYANVTTAAMKMEPPDNYPSPYFYINKLATESVYNDPIVLFTRKPGMVVSYATAGDWTDNIPKTDKGEYIIAVFVANSAQTLKTTGMTLEEYIRKSEKADHMNWDDWATLSGNPNIITRIKRQVRKKIKDDYTVLNTDEGEKKNYGLGKALADFLMPPAGKVYWDDGNGGGRGSGGTGGESEGNDSDVTPVNRTSHVILRQNGQTEFGYDDIHIPIRILFGKLHYVYLECSVDSENGYISAEKWENELNTKFPVELEKFILKGVFKVNNKKKKPVIEDEKEISTDYCSKEISIKFVRSNRYHVCCGMSIEIPEKSQYVVDGVLCYKANGVQGAVNIREEK